MFWAENGPKHGNHLYSECISQLALSAVAPIAFAPILASARRVPPIRGQPQLVGGCCSSSVAGSTLGGTLGLLRRHTAVGFIESED